MLNIALPKGRLGDKVYGLFSSIGYDCAAIYEDNRKLVFENPERGVRYLLVKPSDVATLTAALDEYLALSDDALRAKGEQAFRYLQQNHDIEVFRQEYLDLIDSGLRQALKEHP